jgi:ubiquinone/menaquinone biosynthesis C-methylase UbiE
MTGRARRLLGRAAGRDRAAVPSLSADTYHDLYEAHAQQVAPHESIGAGDFDLVGRVELGALIEAGLRPDHDFVDFGCGTGRLALHAVPYLASGRYVGIDISETMLEEARHAMAGSGGGCAVSWLVQVGTELALPTASVDMIAAFSVFTHLEHEDSYRYLLDARRVVRPGGTFVFSCLTMDLDLARDVFSTSASLSFEARWQAVRNVTTSYELMDAISELAGWRVERWIRGDRAEVPVHGKSGAEAALGQSICVLRR